MSEMERLSGLIGNIYDAALDPARWTEVLPQLGRFVGGPSAALWSEDAAARSANLTCAAGFDAGYVDAYLTRYVNFDPGRSAFCLAKVGEPFARSRIAPDAEFFRTPYFRDWVRPQGLIDCVYVVLDKSGSKTTLFAVSRREHDGTVDENMQRRMRIIARHLRCAALIGRAIDLKSSEAASLADTLDGLGAGTFLVDVTGRIVHANAAGHGILRANDYLRASAGRLFANEPHANRTLHDVFSAAGGGDAALSSKGTAVPLMAHDGTRHVAHVLPLAVGTRRQAGLSRTATAAVFIHKAALEGPTPFEAIAQHFGLTRAELRILVAIVEAGGVPQVASVLGLSETTVRWHLRHLFEKTGTGRQADLVKLVAGFVNPLLRG